MKTLCEKISRLEGLHRRYEAPPVEQRRIALAGGALRLTDLRQTIRARDLDQRAGGVLRAVALRRAGRDQPESDARLQELCHRLGNLRSGAV
ncbi:hypothetical protein [Magnetospira sp. QH-2]|uniref:hypothetical protein n=1 Tax=Magnetospira sp. (strain QH-2) TaxID=1288970 RepID=UPI0003E8125E|nr:hypothetical protein [Magnetospira sp. QH-2]CCQ72351.1 protein of unknown function [Magnetospira sp. QH-2]